MSSLSKKKEKNAADGQSAKAPTEHKKSAKE